MSSDRASTESSQQTAEPPGSLSTGSGPAPRPKPRQPASATKSAHADGTDDLAGNGLTSVPMTATTSASSEVGAESSTPSAPYGTRSRGRNGGPRPNYAEDRDLDLEFEMTSPAPASKAGTSSSKRQTAANSVNGSPATESEKAPSVSTRRGQATANGAHSNSGAKDAIPGTSSFSANLNASNGPSSGSRKRKQPPGSGGSTAVNGSKRGSTTGSGAESLHDYRYSNMMTFENSGARLKNGQLKADDGTSLSVNGMFSHLFVITTGCFPFYFFFLKISINVYPW
jgi:hypothetical protein